MPSASIPTGAAYQCIVHAPRGESQRRTGSGPGIFGPSWYTRAQTSRDRYLISREASGKAGPTSAQREGTARFRGAEVTLRPPDQRGQSCGSATTLADQPSVGTRCPVASRPSPPPSEESSPAGPARVPSLRVFSRCVGTDENAVARPMVGAQGSGSVLLLNGEPQHQQHHQDDAQDDRGNCPTRHVTPPLASLFGTGIGSECRRLNGLA
jgi:hypothetical protein